MKILISFVSIILLISCNSDKENNVNNTTDEIVKTENQIPDKIDIVTKETTNTELISGAKSPINRTEMKVLLNDIGAAKFKNENTNHIFKSIIYDTDSTIKQPCDNADYTNFWFDIGESPESNEEFGSIPYPMFIYEESDQFNYYSIEEMFVSEDSKSISIDLRPFDYDGEYFYIDMASTTISVEIHKNKDGLKVLHFPYSENFEGEYMLTTERNSYPISSCD